MSLFEFGDVPAPGKRLANKFGELGKLQGRTKDEIIAAVGPPNSMYTLDSYQVLLQWLPTGYHIALVFKEDRCVGITTHEFVSQNP